MVNSCAVPLCTNRCKPGSDIRFYRLPLKKPKLLKIWLQRIRCESIPVNEYTRVCSAHFSGNPKRLGPNDIPSIFAWSKPTTPRPTKGRSTVLRYDGGESGCRDSIEVRSISPLSATSNVITNLSDSEKDLHSFEFLHLLADKAQRQCACSMLVDLCQQHNHIWQTEFLRLCDEFAWWFYRHDPFASPANNYML